MGLFLLVITIMAVTVLIEWCFRRRDRKLVDADCKAMLAEMIAESRAPHDSKHW